MMEKLAANELKQALISTISHPTSCYSDTQHLRLHLLPLTLTFIVTVPPRSPTRSPQQKQQEYRIAAVLSIFWIKKKVNTKVHH